MYLNLAHWLKGTRALGPGKRLAIWVQGCCFDCTGCIAQSWRKRRRAKLIGPEELAKLDLDGVDGITISGGEPFLQAKPLAAYLKSAKETYPGLSVIIFTGFTRDDLTWSSALGLIEHVDLLITGPYIPEQNNGTGLRGSANQELIFLTDRLKPWAEEIVSGQRSVELYYRGNELLIVGMPEEKVLKSILGEIEELEK
ncbi:MAG: radical SAM protein [Nitrospirae bacterium]|nr:radical SAM protein [Nitrospirota bacterium]